MPWREPGCWSDLQRCGVRVLVVSEDEMERLRATSALSLHDVEVTELGSAAEARRLLIDDGESFDVLVLDGDMRPRGGFAVLYDLRMRADLAGTTSPPALVMAGRDQDRWLADWAGANDVMVKPVDPFELARRVVAMRGQPAPAYGAHGATVAQLGAAMRDHVHSPDELASGPIEPADAPPGP